MLFFPEYIWIFFFFVLFFFIFIEKKVPREKGALECFGDERREGWREASRWEGSNKEEEEEEGVLEYLSLFSLSPSFSLTWCLCGIYVLRVKLLLLVWFLVGDGGLFGFLQRVATLVLLLHPVHQQHHQEGGEQGPDHTSHYHSCRETEKQCQYFQFYLGPTWKKQTDQRGSDCFSPYGSCMHDSGCLSLSGEQPENTQICGVF